MNRQLPNIVDLINIGIFATIPIKENWRKPILERTKSDGTIVTGIDIKVDDNLKNSFTKQFPILGYVSEESEGIIPPDCSHLIYADPLDGTFAYTMGLPATTTITLMEKRGKLWFPVKAVIIDAIADNYWSGEENQSTILHDSNGNETECMVIKSSFNHFYPKITIPTWSSIGFRLNEIKKFIESDETTYQHQQFGSIALGAGLIANGLMQATIFGGRNAVETVAMSLVVRGAGGVATNLFGEPLTGYTLVKNENQWNFELPKGAIMATDKHLLESLVEIIGKFIKADYHYHE